MNKQGITKRSAFNQTALNWNLGAVLLAVVLSSFKTIAGWEVEWIDTFNSNSVDWQKWTAQVQANYNNEIQCYTADEDTDRANLDVSDGTLKITAYKNSVNCQGLNGESKQWTSARLNSKDKREFLYGRIEARIKFNTLLGGVWPAFWALENRISEHPIKGDNDSVHWPNPGAGEIDIWEWFSNEPNSYITNFFNASGCGLEYRPQYTNGGSEVLDFHVYAMEWTEQEIKFYMDDQVVRTVNISNCAQYKEPMFILINLAVGGSLGGAVDSSLTTATLEVDYIAHCAYTDSNDISSCNESTPHAQDTDGDGISDNVDKCPDTPSNEIVGAEGCNAQIEDTSPDSTAVPPAKYASNVISIFSDVYQDIENVDLNPNWGQSTLASTLTIDEDNLIKYLGLNYQGIAFESNAQDVSKMEFLHFDVWTSNAQGLRAFLISPGPVEKSHYAELTQNQWTSVDIPISIFNGVDLSNVFQLKMEGSGTLFLDNIYFYTESESNEVPSIDSDSDGVNDNLDLCPNSLSSNVDTNGCELTEANVAPTISLTLFQDELEVEQINTINGEVRIVVSVTDVNKNDQHSVIWAPSTQLSGQVIEQSYLFDPSELAPGQYQVSVTVSDNGSPSLQTQQSIIITVNPQQASDTAGSSTNTLIIYILCLLIGARRLTIKK